jgi:hypothetical protein
MVLFSQDQDEPVNNDESQEVVPNDIYNMIEDMKRIVQQDYQEESPKEGSPDQAYEDSESDDDFCEDRDLGWPGAVQRRKSKSPMRAA